MSSNDNNKRTSKSKSISEGYPDITRHKEKILIIVKSSPVPSMKYRELVCTVGVNEDGKLIRLYPIDFRYMPFKQRYTKYQWIEVDIEKNKGDNRIDSYRPEGSSIKLIGKPLSTTKKGWEERKNIIIPITSDSLEELNKNQEEFGVSIGIFKPKNVVLKIEKTTEAWGEKQQKILKQGVLLGPKTKPLDKLPFKFSYEFDCDDLKCKGHSLVIIDWEIYELYRKMKEKYGYSMDLVLDKVRQRWEKDMWLSGRDSYLIVGTQRQFGTFMVLGVFWPPKA